METKITSRKFRQNGILSSFQQPYIIDAIRSWGALALIWENSIPIQIISALTNHIKALAIDPDNNATWTFVGFYDKPKT